MSESAEAPAAAEAPDAVGHAAAEPAAAEAPPRVYEEAAAPREAQAAEGAGVPCRVRGAREANSYVRDFFAAALRG